MAAGERHTRPNGFPITKLPVLTKIGAAGDDSQNGPGDGYPNAYVGIDALGIQFTG